MEVLPKSLLVVKEASSPCSCRPVEESSLVVGQDGLGLDSKGRHFAEEGFLVSLCFSGKESVGEWHPPVVREYSNTPWIVTSWVKRFGEEEKVPSMMMWGA